MNESGERVCYSKYSLFFFSTLMVGEGGVVRVPGEVPPSESNLQILAPLLCQTRLTSGSVTITAVAVKRSAEQSKTT